MVAARSPEFGNRQQVGNGHRGPTTIDLLGTGYSADIYHKTSYVAEKQALADQAEILIAKARLWTPEVAHQMIVRGLEGSDPQNTSWIGFRKSDAPRGEYIGAAWQEEIHIPTSTGDRPDLHMKLRVFEPEAQGKHLGRIAMQLALTVHPESELMSHTSGSPQAVHAWLESGVFRLGRRFPRDIPFDKVRTMPQVLLWLYDTYHINGKLPNMSTGVSIADYLEPNGAYVYNPAYSSAVDYEWMTKGLKMRLERGDKLYEVGEVK